MERNMVQKWEKCDWNIYLWVRNMERKTEEIWCRKWEKYDWNIHLWGQLHYPPLNLGLQLASCCLQLGGLVKYFPTGGFSRVFFNWGVFSRVFSNWGGLVSYFLTGEFSPVFSDWGLS